MNKKGIELSINFIVMLVLAIAVFSGGLMFITKFFSKADEIRLRIDAQTEQQIGNLLDDGSPFVIPIRSREVQNGKFVSFNGGVFNNGAVESTTFKIEIESKGAYSLDAEHRNLCDEFDCESITILPGNTQELTLGINKERAFLFGFQIPSTAPRGDFIYNVKITGPWAATPGYEPIQIILKIR